MESDASGRQKIGPRVRVRYGSNLHGVLDDLLLQPNVTFVSPSTTRGCTNWRTLPACSSQSLFSVLSRRW